MDIKSGGKTNYNNCYYYHIQTEEETSHATTEKPNMYMNIFNKKNQHFDSSYKSPSG